MSASVIELLDATDREQRLRQNVRLLGAVVIAIASIGPLVVGLRSSRVALILLGIAGFGAALALGRLAAQARQRWEVDYKGHPIRFENSPIVGEQLYIDDTLVARGGLGVHFRLEGRIPSGNGAGDTIVAESEARLNHFRCRIQART